MRTLLAGSLALAALLWASPLDADEPRWLGDATCGPTYAAIEPDNAWGSWSFTVIVQGVPEARVYVFPSKPRCQEARQVAVDMLAGLAVVITACA